MKQLPINEGKIPGYNKKAIKLILILIICGIIAGILLSSIFVSEANYRIEHPEEFFKPRNQPFKNNTNDSRFTDFFLENEPLTTYEIILPSTGVTIVCISTFLLIGLIAIYIKIFLTTNSRYIIGLLFFLTPLLIQSLFFLNALRSLFISVKLPEFRDALGFGFGGLGGMLVFISIFEIIGLTILLYLSSE